MTPTQKKQIHGMAAHKLTAQQISLALGLDVADVRAELAPAPAAAPPAKPKTKKRRIGPGEEADRANRILQASIASMGQPLRGSERIAQLEREYKRRGYLTPGGGSGGGLWRGGSRRVGR
jgi:hypothetical protein